MNGTDELRGKAVVRPRGTPGRRTGRRRSREFAMQGLYQWQLAGTDAATIEQQMSGAAGFDKIDRAYFSLLLAGAIREAPRIDAALQPHLDRKHTELSPIEHAILMLAAYEFANHPEVPYKVVINEAVELAKSYGGTDGFKYVNGVLDKLALEQRPLEVAQR